MWNFSWWKSRQKVLIWLFLNVPFRTRETSYFAFVLMEAKVTAKTKPKMKNVFNRGIKQQYKIRIRLFFFFFFENNHVFTLTCCTAASTIWVNLLEIREEWRFFKHVSCYLSAKGQDTLIWKSIILKMPNLYWHFSWVYSPSHFGTILCHEEPLNY